MGGSDLDTNDESLVQLCHVRGEDTSSPGNVSEELSFISETSSTVTDSSSGLVDVVFKVPAVELFVFGNKFLRNLGFHVRI